MKRRDFFKLTAGAAVGMLLPEIALPAVAAERKRVPITLAWLQNSYWSLAFGWDHPTIIYVSPSRFDEIRETIHPAQRYYSDRIDFVSLRFNDADIAPQPYLDNDLAYFINEKNSDRRFNRIVKIGERIS